MQDILAAQGVEVVPESEVGADVEVEAGTTFEENSLLKARGRQGVHRSRPLPTTRGTVVDALNGAPGVYSARYGGEELDDDGTLPPSAGEHGGQLDRTYVGLSRSLHCVCLTATVITARGECRAPTRRRGNGFGYDPVSLS